MLIRIKKLELQPFWSKDSADITVNREIRGYIDPEKISGILFAPDGFDGFACIQCDGQEHWVYEADGDALVEHINGSPAPAAPAPAPEPPQTLPRLAPIVTGASLADFKRMVREQDFVVLDTETTGLEDGEIVQIAIVDKAGDVLLDVLVKPKQPIPADATRIHGITDAMVADSPTWDLIQPEVFRLLQGRHVVIYNAVYDRKMMHKSSERWGLPKTEWKEIAAFWCAMEAYAEVHGDWNRQSYRWQKLSTAARRYDLVQLDAHTALDDAETTRQLALAMAAE